MKLGTRQRPTTSTYNKYNQYYEEKGDKKPKEPFKFPEESRRTEPDTFSVLLKYDVEQKQYYWFAYRAASPEERSQYHRKGEAVFGQKSGRAMGGVAILWGNFLPFCNDNDVKCTKEGVVINKGKEFFVIDPEAEVNKLRCNVQQHGIVKIIGTCLSEASYYKYLVLKQGQGFHIVMSYSPDSEIDLKLDDVKTTGIKSYVPCHGAFCYSIMKKSIDEFSEPIICDFILSFTKMIQDDPAAKLKFDDLIKRELYCPRYPEQCSAYVQDKYPYSQPDGLRSEYERIGQLGLKHYQAFDNDKLSKNDDEFYKNHISSSLRRGKNCRVLLYDNDNFQNDYYVPSKNSFIDTSEDIPQYKPVNGNLKKLESGEFDRIKQTYNQSNQLEKTNLRKLTTKRFD